MQHKTTALNGDFGLMIDGVSRADLEDAVFQREAYDLWTDNGGLVGVRGADLAETSPAQFMTWSSVFGMVEDTSLASRQNRMVPGTPILRIGNVRDGEGNLKASFSKGVPLTSDADIQYNPETRRPVWHTDSTFRANPPIGSVFHCRQAPPEGAETLFADTRQAYAGLDAATKVLLDEMEAVCSLAHHDKKISLYTPGYPLLTEEERAANPPNRVPVVLEHPVSGVPALYGLNSSTCAVVRKGATIDRAGLDKWDLEGIEDDSVLIIRDLLPFITGPDFTVKWSWQPGDIVAWDNRTTMHAATGFDDEQYTREMWRLTLLDRTADAKAA